MASLAAISVTVAGCPSGRDQQNAGSAAAGGASDTTQPVFAQMAGARQPATDSSAPASAQRAFDLCSILPQDTVASVLRATIGKSVSNSTTRAGGMCTYSDAATGAPSVRVLVDIARDRSPAAAGVAFLGTREQLGTQGVATSDINGLGDAAFGASDSTSRYIVMMQSGVLTGNVAVSVRGASASSLRPAATELARRTLAVLGTVR